MACKIHGNKINSSMKLLLAPLRRLLMSRANSQQISKITTLQLIYFPLLILLRVCESCPFQMPSNLPKIVILKLAKCSHYMPRADCIIGVKYIQPLENRFSTYVHDLQTFTKPILIYIYSPKSHLSAIIQEVPCSLVVSYPYCFFAGKPPVWDLFLFISLCCHPELKHNQHKTFSPVAQRPSKGNI